MRAEHILKHRPTTVIPCPRHWDANTAFPQLNHRLSKETTFPFTRAVHLDTKEFCDGTQRIGTRVPGITRQQSVKISFYTTASLRRENVQTKYPLRRILVDRQKSISIDGWVLNDHGIVDLSRYHDMCESRSRLFWVITDTIITIIYASADIVTVRNVLLYSNLIYYPART